MLSTIWVSSKAAAWHALAANTAAEVLTDRLAWWPIRRPEVRSRRRASKAGQAICFIGYFAKLVARLISIPFWFQPRRWALEQGTPSFEMMRRASSVCNHTRYALCEEVMDAPQPKPRHEGDLGLIGNEQ